MHDFGHRRFILHKKMHSPFILETAQTIDHEQENITVANKRKLNEVLPCGALGSACLDSEAGRQYTFGKTALPNQENIPLAKHVFVYIMDGSVRKTQHSHGRS